MHAQNPGALAPIPVQRTLKGLRYDAFVSSARETLSGMSEEDRKKATKANQDFIKGLSSPRHGASYQSELEGSVQRAVTPTSVHVDTLLATMSVMYANDEYIGERLMPAVPVSKRSDKYSVYPKRERLAFPDDAIGFRARSNELDASRSTDNYSVSDYGLANFLDLETVQNQDAPLNEMMDVVEQVNEGIAFKREARIMAIVTASGNYAGNTAGATTNWTDATGGTIIEDILAADAALWKGMGPTRKIGFTTLSVYNTAIANNPKLSDRIKYTAGGLTTIQQVANFFGLDDLLITRSRQDTANSGQTASYSRLVTSEVFGILHVAQRPTLRSAHFGSTFRMQGDPFTTQWTDPGIGKRGGIWNRVAVSEDHKVVAGDAGFLITSMLT